MDRGIEASRAWDRARWTAFALMLGCVALSMALPPGTGAHVPIGRALLRQDLALVALPLLFILARPARMDGVPRPAPDWLPALTATAIVLLCWAGAHLWLNFALSRDEQMANFDAAIFARGQLYAPIAPEWRAHIAALNPMFALPAAGGAGWVSAYLPGNAVLRAIVGVVDPALTSPLLCGGGALALWTVARRLWPDSQSAAVVALALYAGSSQVIVTAMTAYAMTAHLALNLVWLALFLRGGRWGHGGAILTGFVATGLHQPVFHPLFVAPFLWLLLGRREWRTLAAYLIAYAAIGLFWLAWPHWIMGPTAAPGLGFGERLLGALAASGVGGFWAMAANLLRFAVWQHPLLFPLALFGWLAGRRDPVIGALAGGIALTLVAVAAILPFQGHGWGYRYLHGLIGNACLLGGHGWRRLEAAGLNLRRPMIAATALALLAALPVHVWMAVRLVAPVKAASRAASAVDADFVVVEDRAAPYATDLVFNRADLSNRPIRLLGSQLTPAALAALCRGRSVAFVDAPALAATTRAFGIDPPATSPAQRALRVAAVHGGCRLALPVTSR